jgi:LDH2 family malate/lactate/ureidoglycolate dehydrogenase
VRAGVKRILDVNRASGPLWTASLALDRVLPVGVLGLWGDVRVEPARLRDQVVALLRSWGLPEQAAATTAEHVLYADLHGIDSHGCAMLLHYDRGFTSGRLDPGAAPEVVRDSGATALLDGGGGLGHVPAERAMGLAIEKARAHGVGVVAVRNSGHFGAAGAYASMAAAEGLIGVATTNVADASVVPTFGREAKLGTNPIALAAPARRNPPFLLDMATSTASLGAAVVAWRKGRTIPPGWAIDRGGRPVVNGRAAAEGRRLTPLGSTRTLGSHKGYGLGATVEILSRVLGGGSGGEVGHFLMALDPGRFTDEFEAGTDSLIDDLRATEPLDPSQAVLIPGDPEREAADERRNKGIPVARAVVEDMRWVAREAGAEFLL